jgi:hypothetical protein
VPKGDAEAQVALMHARLADTDATAQEGVVMRPPGRPEAVPRILIFSGVPLQWSTVTAVRPGGRSLRIDTVGREIGWLGSRSRSSAE